MNRLHASLHCGILPLLLLLYLPPRLAPAAEPATPATTATAPADQPQQEIQQWIRNLADTDFAKREAADKKLRAIGWPAMSALIIANADTADAEAKTRLTAIIRTTALNHVGLDKETGDLLRKYEAADEKERHSVDLRQSGHDDAEFIAAQAQVLSAGDLYSQTYHFNGQENFLDRYSKTLQKAGAWDELQWNQIAFALLEHGGVRNTTPSQVIWLARKRGNAAHLARALLALRKIQPSGHYEYGFDELLLQLLVASGDADETLKAADLTGIYGGFARLLFLSERRDWSAIAKLPPDKENSNLFDRAAAFQFMGKRAEADALLKYEDKPFEKNTVSISGNHPMLLGRMDLSNRLFVDQGDYPDAVLFLTMQRKYSEIPAVVEKAKAVKDRQAEAVESLLIPVYARLNEVERVCALVKALSGKGDDMNRQWIQEAIAEAQQTLSDIDLGVAPIPGIVPMELPDARSVEKQMWMEVLKAKPGEPSDNSKEVERILADKPTPQQIEKLVAYSPEIPAELRGRPELSLMQSQLDLWKAYILHKASRDDLAEELIRAAIKALKVEDDAPVPEELKDDPAQAALFRKRLKKISQYQLSQVLLGDERFGIPTVSPVDMILAVRDWKFSRSVLESLAAEEGPGPVFKYLLGVCLEKLGDAQGGAALKKQADDQLEGDVHSHTYLAHILYRSGEIPLWRQQAQLVLDLHLEISETRCDIHNFLAQMAFDSGEYPAALDHLRLVVINKFHYFHMPEDRTVYIRIPRQMSYCEARIALAKNDLATALEAAKSLTTFDPEDLTLTLQLIAAFKQAKFNDQAAALAVHNRSLLEAILKDFPNSHLHHYLIAKLDLDSGFTTDQTLLHLRKALELAPKNSDYLQLQSRAASH